MFPFIIEAIKGRMARWDVLGGHQELVAEIEQPLQDLWPQGIVVLCQQKRAENDGFVDYQESCL